MTVSGGDVELELAAAAAKCREVLRQPEFAALAGRLPDAPADAEGWFRLLEGYPHKTADEFKRIAARWPADAAAAGVNAEYYAAVQALNVAIPLLPRKPLPRAVMRYFAAFCVEATGRERQWQDHFDAAGDPHRFQDMAELVTLRRFIAGDLSFAFEPLAPLRWPMCVHPLSLPGLIFEMVAGMRGIYPTLVPHLNYGRKGSLIVRQEGFERALWLTAKAMEMMPEVRGVSGVSWFYSAVVGETFPHLAWMRRLFTEGGAYVVELYPLEPTRYGFAHNSPKRLKLYEEGKFCPRQTLILWPRTEFLAWAAAHPALGGQDGTDDAVHAAPRRLRLHLCSPRPPRHTKHNSGVRLWDGIAAYDRLGKIKYVAPVILGPAVAAAGVAALAGGVWAAVPAFVAGLFGAHAFQYFFSQ